MTATSLAFDIFAKDRASDKFEKVGKSADGLGSKLSGMAKAGAFALAGLAVAAGGLAVKFTKMAIEDEAAQAKMAKALQNTTGATKAQISATEDYITKMGQMLGVADDDLRPAISRLAVATGDLRKAQSLSMIAMNVSAGTGKNLKTVTEALAKAQQGNLSGLSRLGVATKDAAGNTLSLDQITKNLANTYAGQASTAAETTAGKFERLKLRASELQESIGAKLIPVADKLAGFMLNDLGPALAKVGDWARENLAPAFAKVGNFISTKVIPAAQQFASWFMDKIAPGIKATVTPVLEGLRSAFSKIGEKIEENRPQLEKLKDAFAKIAEFIATKVAPVLGAFAGAQLKVLGDAIGGIITAVSWLVDKFSALIQKVKDFGSAIGGIAGKAGDILSIVPGLRISADAGGFSPGAGSFSNARAGGSVAARGSVIGVLEVVHKSPGGRVIQRELLELKRNNGGAALGIA